MAKHLAGRSNSHHNMQHFSQMKAFADPDATKDYLEAEAILRCLKRNRLNVFEEKNYY